MSDASLSAFVAAYLLSPGAYEQILRTGSCVRCRSYGATHLQTLLLPPVVRSATITENYWRLGTAAANLDVAWHDGVLMIEQMLEMPSLKAIWQTQTPRMMSHHNTSTAGY